MGPFPQNVSHNMAGEKGLPVADSNTSLPYMYMHGAHVM